MNEEVFSLEKGSPDRKPEMNFAQSRKDRKGCGKLLFPSFHCELRVFARNLSDERK